MITAASAVEPGGFAASLPGGALAIDDPFPHPPPHPPPPPMSVTHHPMRDPQPLWKEFLETKGLHALLEDLLNVTLLKQPADVVPFMVDYLRQKCDTDIVIDKIVGRTTVDSRGSPTVEVDVFCLIDGLSKHVARAAAPTAVVPHPNEPLENRDASGDFTTAAANVGTLCTAALRGHSPFALSDCDTLLRALDEPPCVPGAGGTDRLSCTDRLSIAGSTGGGEGNDETLNIVLSPATPTTVVSRHSNPNTAAAAATTTTTTTNPHLMSPAAAAGASGSLAPTSAPPPRGGAAPVARSTTRSAPDDTRTQASTRSSRAPVASTSLSPVSTSTAPVLADTTAPFVPDAAPSAIAPPPVPLGCVAMLATSCALALTCASVRGAELFSVLGSSCNPPRATFCMPIPVVNVLNGHKRSAVACKCKVQEFMILPAPNVPFRSALRQLLAVHQQAGILSASKPGGARVAGDEGAFSPGLETPHEMFSLLEEAVKLAGLTVGQDIFFGMDAAAQDAFDPAKNRYSLLTRTWVPADKLLKGYEELFAQHPAIVYIEDPVDPTDTASLQQFILNFGSRMTIVANDLACGNTKSACWELLNSAQCPNAVMSLKLNHHKTITSCLEFAKSVKDSGADVVVCARTAEPSLGTYVADVAVAANAKFVKLGGPARGERVAKYNRLAEIEEILISTDQLAKPPAPTPEDLSPTLLPTATGAPSTSTATPTFHSSAAASAATATTTTTASTTASPTATLSKTVNTSAAKTTTSATAATTITTTAGTAPSAPTASATGAAVGLAPPTGTAGGGGASVSAPQPHGQSMLALPHAATAAAATATSAAPTSTSLHASASTVSTAANSTHTARGSTSTRPPAPATGPVAKVNSPKATASKAKGRETPVV